MSVASTIKRMGKKRTPPTASPRTPSEKFAANLSGLVGDNARQVAEAVGVSHDAVLKWCRGDSVPALDKWPALAEALKLKDWRKLLPPL